jgi:ankyrin repeat protein
VDSKDQSDRSPLSYAAEGGSIGYVDVVVKLLLAQKGVEVDSKDQSGRSPLSYAAEGWNFKVAQLFLARGDIKVDSKDSSGRSPLSYATAKRRLGSVKSFTPLRVHNCDPTPSPKLFKRIVRSRPGQRKHFPPN